MKLAFVEKREHIDRILKRTQGYQGVRFMALTPEAMYELEKRGIEYGIPEDFYSEEDLGESSRQIFQMVREVVDYLDHSFRKESRILDSAKIEVFRDFYSFHLKFYLLDPVFARIFALRSVLQKLDPEEAVFFERKGCPSYRDRWVSPWLNRPLYPACLETLLKHHKVKYVKLTEEDGAQAEGGEPRQTSRLGLKGRILDVLRKNDHLVQLHLFLKLIGYRHVFSYFLRPSKANILVAAPMEDTEQVLPSLAKAGLGILYWRNPLVPADTPRKIFPLSSGKRAEGANGDASMLRGEAKAIWESLKERKEFKELWAVDGINLFGIMAPQLDWLFTEGLAELFQVYSLARETIAQHEIKLVILGQGGCHPPLRVVQCAAKCMGVPSISWQHGGLYGYSLDISIACADLEVSDYFLCWGGQGAAQCLRKLGTLSAHPAQIISVGSLSLSKLRRDTKKLNRRAICRELGLDPDRMIVMYVPNALSGPDRFLPHSTYPPNLYYRWQRGLVDVLAGYPHQFIVKQHYKERDTNPLSEYIEDHKIDNGRVLANPLVDLLPIADLFIVDFPSTVLLQVLTTKKKVIVFTHLPDHPLFPGAVEALRKRVSFSSDYEEFLRIVQDTLERGDFAPVSDEEFMLEYGNCSTRDSETRSRITAEICRIALNGEHPREVGIAAS